MSLWNSPWVKLTHSDFVNGKPYSTTLPSNINRKQFKKLDNSKTNLIHSNRGPVYPSTITPTKLNQPSLKFKQSSITAYWEGYIEENINPYPLNEVPEYVNNITIAFIQPIKKNISDKYATDWDFDDTFIYSKEQIRKWINEINERNNGQKVFLSILDTPSCHWYPNVDIDAFAKNIARSCDEWNLGGIDVDAESGMDYSQYSQTFINLIKSLRKYLSKDKKIIYTCYTCSNFDAEILNKTHDCIDILNTMAYWDDLSGMQYLYNFYSNAIKDPSKVGIGCKAGDQESDGSVTKLDVVKSTAQWCYNDGHPRMMLWSLTRDVCSINKIKDNQWLNTMVENMKDIKNKKNQKNKKDFKQNLIYLLIIIMLLLIILVLILVLYFIINKKVVVLNPIYGNCPESSLRT